MIIICGSKKNTILTMFDLIRSYSENRLTSSLPFRRKREREEAEGTFSTFSSCRQHNYDHDVNTLKLSAANIHHSIKKLAKLQKDIRRKSEKRKSKYLELNKEDYDGCIMTVLDSLKRITKIVSDEGEDNIDRSRTPGRCHACFQKDRDLMLLQSQNESLQTEYERINKELTNERRDKQDATKRLSALTSPKLQDNNPVLPDLSDATRPSKIGETFSELYDNEWTDAYDELSETSGEAETIQHLNDLLMNAYDCCVRLSNPTRLFLDTKSTKIDSELRQNVIGHIKRNATAVISELKKDLQSEILKRSRVSYQTPRVLDYIGKSIEICWLMAVQDPPMYLYNVKTPQFESANFKTYSCRGPYTEYVVWPALALYENGPLLAKGVAQGSDQLYVACGSTASYFKSTGRSKPTAGNEKSTGRSAQEENRIVEKAVEPNMKSVTKQLTGYLLCDQTATKQIVSDERDDNTDRGRRPGRCHACFRKDRDLMLLQAQNDSLQTEFDRLSALTSSKLRDNNPNLTDLSDANRPSKIGEMFSELYDDEWTDAYDELSQTKKEAETIQYLNHLLMDAYDCCMRLSNPIRLFLDTKSTKIDSEFRQKVIGHIKRNATTVISELKKDLESEILKRCRVFKPTTRVLDYINKSIEICWLMAVQDPPMYIYNDKTRQFDSAKFREYQHRGFYTEYIVWPALALYENGPLLSKGVAQGCDKLYVSRVIIAENIKPIGRSKQEGNSSEKGLKQAWHPTHSNSPIM